MAAAGPESEQRAGNVITRRMISLRAGGQRELRYHTCLRVDCSATSASQSRATARLRADWMTGPSTPRPVMLACARATWSTTSASTRGVDRRWVYLAQTDKVCKSRPDRQVGFFRATQRCLMRALDRLRAEKSIRCFGVRRCHSRIVDVCGLTAGLGAGCQQRANPPLGAEWEPGRGEKGRRLEVCLTASRRGQLVRWLLRQLPLRLSG